ncbi:unnamed protein product [Amoebophrya sp. A25]|nr:unnamed protein product [Amoebophrya sp. A25]|eukprot:GSA25T00013698001.1
MKYQKLKDFFLREGEGAAKSKSVESEHKTYKTIHCPRNFRY